MVEGEVKSEAKEVERRRLEGQAQASKISADAEAKRVVVEGEAKRDAKEVEKRRLEAKAKCNANEVENAGWKSSVKSRKLQ